MLTGGAIAISAISPNASVPGFPPEPAEAPTVSVSIKVLDKGPVATLPESKPICVNKAGEKKVNKRAKRTKGANNHQMLKPKRTLRRESATAIATAIATVAVSTGLLIFSEVTSSTCWVNTHIEGSAQTIKAPKMPARGTRIHDTSPSAKSVPRAVPVGIKPVFAPKKKRTRPIKA